MKKFNELYRPSKQGITYERYSAILDGILVEDLQEQKKGNVKINGSVYAYDLNDGLIYTFKQVQNNLKNVIKVENKLKIDEDYIRFLKLNIDKVPEEDSLILKKAS